MLKPMWVRRKWLIVKRFVRLLNLKVNFVRQSGGRGQYGHVWLRIEPQEAGADYEFVNEIVGGVVPKEYINAIDKGIQEQMGNGVIAGFPVVDVKVTLYDGSYHDVDSNEMAFKIAASMGFKNGALRASPVFVRTYYGC